MGGEKMTADAYTKFLDTHFGSNLAPAVLKQYPISNYKTPFFAAVDALGDQAMSCPARETARYLSDAKVPVYLYFFVHELNWLKIEKRASSHIWELVDVICNSWNTIVPRHRTLAIV